LLFIISFISLVYNDFVVLYFCGLEYNTHLEINYRAKLYEKLSYLIEDDNSSEKEKSNNQKLELSKI